MSLSVLFSAFAAFLMKSFRHPNLDDVQLSAALQALADPCRQQIVLALKEAGAKELACNEFVLHVSKATASHHFETLRAVGIIRSRAEGAKCLSSLRQEEFERRFPGLLDLVAADA